LRLRYRYGKRNRYLLLKEIKICDYLFIVVLFLACNAMNNTSLNKLPGMDLGQTLALDMVEVQVQDIVEDMVVEQECS
jgi:hypothetical protein